NISALGSKIVLVGVVGDDPEAVLLREKLEAANVHCHFKHEPDKPTITKLRVLSHNQQLIRMDFEEALYQQSEESPLLNLCRQHFEGTRAIIMSDYGKGSIGAQQPIIQAAKTAGIPVLVDPKGSDFSIYRGVALLTPNYKEFEAVVGTCYS